MYDPWPFLLKVNFQVIIVSFVAKQTRVLLRLSAPLSHRHCAQQSYITGLIIVHF